QPPDSSPTSAAPDALRRRPDRPTDAFQQRAGAHRTRLVAAGRRCRGAAANARLVRRERRPARQRTCGVRDVTAPHGECDTMSATHFADGLADLVHAKQTSLCVGLDPRWESLPAAIRARHGCETLDAVAAAFEEFCGRVLDLVAPIAPVVKPQSAFFEACGPPGMATLQRLLHRARGLGLLTILDAKRNDIA